MNVQRDASEAGRQSSPIIREAKFAIGDVVRHRVFPFRGVIFDVDPTFNNTEEWWLSIPEHVRPRKDQPFYHLLAENDESAYVAYVSEQNLLVDETGEPVGHPQAPEIFEAFEPLQAETPGQQLTRRVNSPDASAQTGYFPPLRKAWKSAVASG